MEKRIQVAVLDQLHHQRPLSQRSGTITTTTAAAAAACLGLGGEREQTHDVRVAQADHELRRLCHGGGGGGDGGGGGGGGGGAT